MWKTIRVFISSTFRDMHAERDHLVRFVFPRLRELLLPRRIHLIDVDLRWGVTREQDATEVCREIIVECRPRFLCMLGGRYGEVPSGRKLSITADEVHFGVFNCTEKMYALFYTRHGAVTERMDRSAPGLFREPKDSKKAASLAQLKRGIRRSGRPHFLYTGRWDAGEKRLLDLETFGSRVAADILATIDDEFGVAAGGPADEFADENAAIEAYVEAHTARYVVGSRQSIVRQIFDHAAATGGSELLIVAGAPGSGKSALMAQISRSPELKDPSTTLLITHFVGAGVRSTDVRLTIRRLCHELKAGFPQIAADIPDDINGLQTALVDFLRQACVQKRVVMLLDGVDQFDTTRSGGLFWLPRERLANARIILSCPPGAVLDELRRRQPVPPEVHLQHLSSEDGTQIIEHFRLRYHKSFEADQRAALLAKTDAGTPLYLLAALEELRTLGTYEEISARITELPPTAGELFAWILRRLAHDEEFRDQSGRRIGRELVPRFAALLASSRHGLSQRELVDLLDSGDPRGNVAALLRLVRPYLMQRGELLDFYHGQFREASLGLWLATDQQRRHAHAALSGYFQQRADPGTDGSWRDGDERAMAQLPYHLAPFEQERLARILTDVRYLSGRCDRDGAHALLGEYELFRDEHHVARQVEALLRRHVRTLSTYPDSLLSLCLHEGHANAQAAAMALVKAKLWHKPWVRATRIPLPAPQASHAQPPALQVGWQYAFPRSCATDMAGALALRFKRLGQVAIIDLRRLEELPHTLAIRPLRPLGLFISDDQRLMAVAFENGEADIHRLLGPANGSPTSAQRLATVKYLLPEMDAPVMLWLDDLLCYQRDEKTLVFWRMDSEQAVALHARACGELAGAVETAGELVVAVRQGPGASVTRMSPRGENSVQSRGNAAVSCICACDLRQIAVAWSDCTIGVYDLDPSLTQHRLTRVPEDMQRMGWDGERLLSMSRFAHLFVWKPAGAEAPVRVQHDESLFAPGIQAIASRLEYQGEGVFAVITDAIAAQFSLEWDAADSPPIRQAYTAGSGEVIAIQNRMDGLWVVDGGHETRLADAQEASCRPECGLDGQRLLLASNGFPGGSVMLELDSRRIVPCPQVPQSIASVAGDALGGFWINDRAGRIYHVWPCGECRLVAEIPLDGASVGQLLCRGERLIWFGRCNVSTRAGTENVRAMVFYRCAAGEAELIGKRTFATEDGRFEAWDYDAEFDRVAVVSFNVMRDQRMLRHDVPERIMSGSEDLRPTIGLSSAVRRLRICRGGQRLAALCADGSLCWVDAAGGRRLACLLPSVRFGDMVQTAIVDDSVLLVEDQIRVVHCRLEEP
jgi:hypothetical protein